MAGARVFCFVVAGILATQGGQYLLAQGHGFAFREVPGKKQIDITYNGNILTAYCYYDSVMKPVLFPVKTISGVVITRGYPLEPRRGERVDHPHHVGLWLNYQDVNGLDFWNNSTAIPYDRRESYGTIYHDKVVRKKASGKNAVLEVQALWNDHHGAVLLTERTTYQFSVSGDNFIIDRATSLKATGGDVSLADIKDGFLAIRVARELELPSNEPAEVVGPDGEIIEARLGDNASGNYVSSEGLTGNDVWATRARWVTLAGKKDGKNVSVTIIDHPGNPGYPAYWHARGYGLFAVNPLGQAVFSGGKEKLNLVVKENDAVTFRYRIVIHEGSQLTAAQIDAMAKF